MTTIPRISPVKFSSGTVNGLPTYRIIEEMGPTQRFFNTDDGNRLGVFGVAQRIASGIGNMVKRTLSFFVPHVFKPEAKRPEPGALIRVYYTADAADSWFASPSPISDKNGTRLNQYV